MNKSCILCAITLLASVPGMASARQGEAPYSISAQAKAGVAIPVLKLAGIDAKALRQADDTRLLDNTMAHDKRMAIAAPVEVTLSPVDAGVWQSLGDGQLMWRANIQVPGATDLHLGFERGQLPKGASLWVIGAGDHYEGPYTEADGMPLWIPMLPGDIATIEIHLAAGASVNADLPVLTAADAGFRDLFAADARVGNPGASGTCNINVVCPLGQPYSDEARALTYYEFRASDGVTYICTGTLLNDVPGDRRNYVLTAAHCLSTQAEAQTMRLYWNYRSTSCETNTGISFAQNQVGANLRATRADADFTLVELTQAPDQSWNLFRAGWDAEGIAPSSSIGLHHPSGDVAKVTNNPTAPSTGNNCIGTGVGSVNTHWFTGPYDQGTTEGGSSGSGLWIPANDAGGRGKRLIGVLSGGTAFCAGAVPDDGFDCYGKFAAAWNGSAASSRLRDWLDPNNTGTQSIAGMNDVPGTGGTIPAGLASRIASGEMAERVHDGGDRGVGGHVRPINPDERRP